MEKLQKPVMDTEESYIRSMLLPRKKNAHKGDFGKVLIFAGSVGMAGAAVLCGKAALRGGAGLVQYLLPSANSPLLPVLQTAVPEATCVFWSFAQPHSRKFMNAADGGKESRSAFPGLRLSDYTSVVAGCGLGKSEEAKEILTFLIRDYEHTLVLDADALNLIAGSGELAEAVRTSSARIILTPHIGEARRLLHTEDRIEGPESREKAVLALAANYRCTAVLKGAGTLVAHLANSGSASYGTVCLSEYENTGNLPGDRTSGRYSKKPADTDPPGKKVPEYIVYRNTTGNPGMATAGSGDVLAGLTGALAARGFSPEDAARISVFLHGKAGDLAALQLGETGMTASDIVQFLPAAFRTYGC